MHVELLLKCFTTSAGTYLFLCKKETPTARQLHLGMTKYCSRIVIRAAKNIVMSRLCWMFLKLNYCCMIASERVVWRPLHVRPLLANLAELLGILDDDTFDGKELESLTHP